MKIKFLVMDVDGTLTDGRIYMSASGELFKAFDIKDGCGIKDILPKYGIIPVIITARESQLLLNRCKELAIAECHQGIRDKYAKLQEIISEYSKRDNVSYCMANVAYIGDDILDLKCMQPVKQAGGIIGCPLDAVSEIKKIADFVSSKNAGNGAVREFIEYLINIGNCNTEQSKLHDRLNWAMKYIQELDKSDLVPGRYDVAEDFYYTVQEYEPIPVEKSRYETHRNHIDIQFMVKGVERLYFTDAHSLTPNNDYNSEKDVEFYSNSDNESSVVFSPGSCVVLYPKDAHRSERLLGDKIFKIVGKLRISKQ